MSRTHECEYDSDGGGCRICGKTVAEQLGSFAAPAGSAADPRVGKLTGEDAAMLKKLAEDMGALDCMPAWMRAEIEDKTKPPNHY